MDRKAGAVWKGGLKDGKGTLTTQSGTLTNTQYSFGSRFESGTGTNPEELLAAAHAGCFTMAFSAQLSTNGFTPDTISTECTISLEKLDAGWAVTKSHLICKARVPGIDKAKFEELANNAKAGCPVSKLYQNNAQITLDLSMES